MALDVYHAAPVKFDPETVVLFPGSMDRAEEIGKYFENREYHKGLRTEHSIWTGTYKGQKVAAVSSGMGPSSIAIIGQELILLGARKILRLGTCGGLQPNIKIGDILVARDAKIDEDVSKRFYKWEAGENPPAHYSSIEAAEKAREFLGWAEEDVHVGTIHTKSALERELRLGPYADEHKMYMECLEKEGVIGSSMESTVLFTLAYSQVEPEEGQRSQLHQRILTNKPDAYDPKEVKAGALLVAVGGYDPELDENVPYGTPKQVKSAEKKAVEFGLEAAVQWGLMDKV